MSQRPEPEDPRRQMRWTARLAPVLGLVLVASAISSCASGAGSLRRDDGRLQVVVTTGILRDLVSRVGGNRVAVASLVPDGADPHGYEPSLRSIRNVVYADVAFSNYLMFEQHSIIKALDANLPTRARNVSLAEEAVRYAAEFIPLVEDLSLDTIWLGMRVRGSGQRFDANRSSDVLFRAVDVEGPGDLFAYLTTSFGEPELSIDSTDGFHAGNGYRHDTTTLPPDAHTHMSWAFTEPGVYRLAMEAVLAVSPEAQPIELGQATFTFAVGVNPHDVAPGVEVLDAGHADLTVDLDTGGVYLYADPHGGGDATQIVHDAATTVIAVPSKALLAIPSAPGFRFLGRPGDHVYQLPQAVLGRHVHGEIDPHLWHNVKNAISYVELIRDTLVEVDPRRAAEYVANAGDYIVELERLDADVRDTIATIPEARRHLVTTHDAFGYLGAAYDLEISGFVTPNPAGEPSLADRRRLTETIRNLAIPAVFLEPNLAQRSSTLTDIARTEGIEICRLYGDSFDREVKTYVELMRFNAGSLRECLTAR